MNSAAARWLTSALAFAATDLPAQARKAAQPKANRGLRAIAMEPADAKWQFPANAARNFTIDGSGVCWLVARRLDEDGVRRRAVLLTSNAAGETWREAAVIPIGNASHGAITLDPTANALHVAFSARNDDQGLSAYYCRFDLDTATWVGEPHLLEKGTGANDQFMVQDVETTPSGQLAISIGSHRSPRSKTWRGHSWSCGLRIRSTDGKWSKLHHVNTGSTGLSANLQAVGEVIHATYRSITGGCGIYHRAFDVESASFLTEQHQLVSRIRPNRDTSSNSSNVVADSSGRLYVMYTTGKPGAGSGELVVATADTSEQPLRWKHTKLTDDPLLRGGNFSYSHFGLTPGPGDLVYALYSKKSEQHRTLYRQTLSEGELMGTERQIAHLDFDNAFLGINGIRDTHRMLTIQATSSSDAGAHLIGRRWPIRVVPR